jgi:hypothetical protein
MRKQNLTIQDKFKEAYKQAVEEKTKMNRLVSKRRKDKNE